MKIRARSFISLIVLILLASICVVGAFAIDLALRDASEKIVQSVIDGVADASGLIISFDYMSPSVLRSLDLWNARIGEPGKAPLLKAAKLSISYDLWSLMMGKLDASTIKLDLQDVHCLFDLDADPGLFSRIGSRFAGEGESKTPSIRVAGRDLRIAARYLGVDVLVDVESVEMDIERSGITVDGKAMAELSRSGKKLGKVVAEAKGEIGADLSIARLMVNVGFDSESIRILPRRYSIVKDGDVIDVRRVASNEPVDIRFTLDMAKGEFAIATRFERFSPYDIVNFPGLKEYDRVLTSKFSGSIWAGGSIDLAYLNWSADLAGTVPIAFLERAWDFSISASGNLEGANVKSVRVYNRGGYAEFSGGFSFRTLLPNGSLAIAYEVLPNAEPLRLRARIETIEGQAFAVVDDLKLGGISFSDTLVFADFDDRRAKISMTGMVEPSGENDQEEASRIVATALLEYAPSLFLELEVETQALPLKRLRGTYAAFGIEPWLAPLVDRVKVSVTAFLSTDFSSLSYSFPDLIATVATDASAFAAFSVDGTLSAVNVRKAIINYSGYTIEGDGYADFSNVNDILFACSLRLSDIPYSFMGSVLEGSSLILTGDYGFSLSVNSSEGRVAGTLTAKELPIAIDQTMLFLSANANASLVSLDDWLIDLKEFGLSGSLPGEVEIPPLFISATIEPRRAKASEIRVSVGEGDLHGEGSFAYDLSGFDFFAGDVELIGEHDTAVGVGSGGEVINCSFMYDGGDVGGLCTFSGFPVERFGDFDLTGAMNGSLELDGTRWNPILSYSIAMPAGRYLDIPLFASVSGDVTYDRLEAKTVTVGYAGHTLKSGRVGYGFEDGSFFAELAYGYRLGYRELTASMTAHGEKTDKGFVADVLLGAIAFGPMKVDAWNVGLSFADDRLSIIGGDGEAVGYYALDGHFAGSFRPPFPILAEMSGSIVGSAIDVTADVADIAAPFVFDVLGLGGVEAGAGKGSGTLTMKGPVNDPNLDGAIEIKGLELGIPVALADTVGPFDAKLTFDGNRITSGLPFVRSGNGILSYDLLVELSNWSLVQAVISANVSKDYPIRTKMSLPMMDIDGEAYGSFSILFDDYGMTVGGTATLSDTGIEVNPAKPWPWKDGSKGMDTRLDVRVHTASDVQIFFPTKQFPILSGYIDTSSSVDVKMDGSSGTLAVTGALNLRSGDIYYIQRDFVIKQGSVVFNETERKFDPRITVLAERRERYKDAPIIIYLKANDQPVTSFTPSLESVPALSEGEIVALLGESLFVSDSNEGELDVYHAIIASSEIISQSSVIRGFEDAVKDTFGLDMFSIRTEFFQRLLIDIFLTDTSSMTNFAEYFDNTSIYIGKYLNDVLFFQAILTLQAADPLVSEGTLTINSAFGLEFNTPFFLLQWSISPETLDTLFIGDQSISLFWTFSL